MMQSVLSIDPGKMTGVAYTSFDGKTVELIYSGELSPDDLIPELRPILKLWKQPEGHAPLRVVIERFIINSETGKKSQEASWALRMTGAVEQALRDEDYPESAIVWQTPAEVKSTFPNPTLKSLGIWHKGGAGHALDAIRHNLYYLVRVGWSRGGDTPS